ncbi:hypothetical protein GCM10010206_62590 [Streptomyces cinerochromogenes]|nr:hypothetical protein GCM10010206_62590 [Streptomyces cinerochromogenes]
MAQMRLVRVGGAAELEFRDEGTALSEYAAGVARLACPRIAVKNDCGCRQFLAVRA